MTTQNRPLRIFCSYAREDDALRRKLEKHLAALRRDRRVELWSDRKIVAGTDWRASVRDELDHADLILLLTSSDFIDSEFCYSTELQRALERFAKREAMVIPVALRPVEWSGTPLEGLQALPRDGKPITLWADRDKAFADVARGIREAVEHFAEWRNLPPIPASLATGPAPAIPVTPAEAPSTPESKAAVSLPTPFLKRVFGEVDFRPIGWFEQALVAASAIARIETPDRSPIGTGFLVRAAEFGPGIEGESLLVTCSYIAVDSERTGGGAPFAYFERLGVRRQFKTAVWTSPLHDLDVHLIRLDGPVDTKPCSLSQRDPGELDQTTAICVAGHPLGGPLQFSLWKTAWLDYKTPRLHYRASTEGGSGGSAVFDEEWQVIALHRAASVHMPRLHGEGKYAACEGMSLRDIRNAVTASSQTKPRRVVRRKPMDLE